MVTDSCSVEHLAGCRLMAGFEGTGLNDDLKWLVGDLKVAGIILFACNIASPEQVAALCRDAQAHARRRGLPPLFIAVDQEGGTVARFRAPFTEFPGNPSLKNRRDAADFAKITATELRRVGVNMNFAPVLDIVPDDTNGVMTARAFSGSPETVAEMGAEVIRQLQKHGVMAVGKHFPGIGRTTLDSHMDRPVLDVRPEVMSRTDLVPFQNAMTADVSGIMLSHVVYPRLDKTWPASLSPVIAKDLLRKKLGYEGVTMTDDLDMGAISRYTDVETVMGQVLKADIDLALICHKGPDIEKAWNFVRAKLTSGSRLRGESMTSARRVMALKSRHLSG